MGTGRRRAVGGLGLAVSVAAMAGAAISGSGILALIGSISLLIALLTLDSPGRSRSR